jgi:hypothetical protein
MFRYAESAHVGSAQVTESLRRLKTVEQRSQLSQGHWPAKLCNVTKPDRNAGI